jgi:GTPase
LQPTAEHIIEIADDLRHRLSQGSGEAILELGVYENGSPLLLSETDFALYLKTVTHAAESIHARLTVLTTKRAENGCVTGYALLRLELAGQVEDVLEVRVACCGNVDAGKSTLLGVLTTGDLDDGRGRSRVHLFKHKHEIESGRTSSVGMELLGFDVSGRHVCHESSRKITWEEISRHASKVRELLV